MEQWFIQRLLLWLFILPGFNWLWFLDLSLCTIFFHQTNIFPLLRKNFYNQIFFLHEGSFKQANMFPPSRKFSTSKYFSFTNKSFYKQTFFLCQGTFLEANYDQESQVSKPSLKILCKNIFDLPCGKKVIHNQHKRQAFNYRFV